jgi:hypothetical protein
MPWERKMTGGDTFNMAEEFADVDFNEERLKKRFLQTMETVSKDPRKSIYGGSRNRAETKSIYSLLGNDKFNKGEILGRVHTTQSDTNTSGIDKSRKDTSKFVIAGANPSKSLEPPEKPLYLLPPFIEFLVIVPRLNPVPLRRYLRFIPRLPRRYRAYLRAPSPPFFSAPRASGCTLTILKSRTRIPRPMRDLFPLPASVARSLHSFRRTLPAFF